MHQWKIVVDTSAEMIDLSPLKQRVQPGVDLVFDYVSYGFTVDEHFYSDEELVSDEATYDLDSILTWIEQAKEVTTGVNAPGVVMKAMQGAENVIFIALSSGISGGFAAAEVGETLLKTEQPGVNTFIVDSKSLSGEQRLLAYKAIDLINEGLSFEAVVEQLKRYHQSTYLINNQANIDGWVATGRIDVDNNQKVGTFHKRGLVRRTDAGVLSLHRTIRGSRRSVQAVFKFMEDMGYQGGRVILTSVLNDRLANLTQRKIKRVYPQADIEIVPALPTLARYYMRGAVNVAFEGKTREN